MRIAQIAPLAESVPPKLYGGTERVVAWLVDELLDLGHDVTLFAAGDSVTRAKLVAGWPQALRLGRSHCDPMAAQAALLESVAERAQMFDVLHFHIDWLHLPLLSRSKAAFLTTCHNRLDLTGFSDLVARFPRAHFVSISDNQRIPLKEANWLGTVYHGLPAQSLLPCFERGKYLAFLGRLTADKGPEAAIRIAKRAGLPLRIAAKIPRGDRGYFAQKIAPQVDNREVELVGEVDDKAKQGFLSNAAALLFPIDWPEPFGLVMIESMACGTPVIAYRRGSVPEVVEDRATGFVVDTEDEAVQAVTRLNEIDRKQVRAGFESRFTARRMAENYVRHYEQLTQGRASDLPLNE